MDKLKRLISTPNILLPIVILLYGIVFKGGDLVTSGLVIALLVMVAVLNVGNKQLWK